MASKFQPVVRKCITSDIPLCMSVTSQTFGHDAAFVDYFFPNHDTPSGHASGTARLQKWFNSGSSTFLTAEIPDGPNDGIVAIAIWTFMKEEEPLDLDQIEDVDKIWGSVGGEREMKFMREMWTEYVRPRNGAIKEARRGGVWGKCGILVIG